MKSPATVLKLGLAAETLTLLESGAALHGQTLEEFARLLLDRALRQEERGSRRLKGASATRVQDRAPLDAFLPEGANPFIDGDEALSFAEQQTRLRFAGNATLLRSEG